MLRTLTALAAFSAAHQITGGQINPQRQNALAFQSNDTNTPTFYEVPIPIQASQFFDLGITNIAPPTENVQKVLNDLKPLSDQLAQLQTLINTHHRDKESSSLIISTITEFDIAFLTQLKSLGLFILQNKLSFQEAIDATHSISDSIEQFQMLLKDASQLLQVSFEDSNIRYEEINYHLSSTLVSKFTKQVKETFKDTSGEQILKNEKKLTNLHMQIETNIEHIKKYLTTLQKTQNKTTETEHEIKSIQKVLNDLQLTMYTFSIGIKNEDLLQKYPAPDSRGQFEKDITKIALAPSSTRKIHKLNKFSDSSLDNQQLIIKYVLLGECYSDLNKLQEAKRAYIKAKSFLDPSDTTHDTQLKKKDLENRIKTIQKKEAFTL